MVLCHGSPRELIHHPLPKRHILCSYLSATFIDCLLPLECKLHGHRDLVCLHHSTWNHTWETVGATQSIFVEWIVIVGPSVGIDKCRGDWALVWADQMKHTQLMFDSFLLDVEHTCAVENYLRSTNKPSPNSRYTMLSSAKYIWWPCCFSHIIKIGL